MQSVLVCFIIFSLVSTSVYSVDLTHIIPDFFNRITGLPIYRTTYRTTPITIIQKCVSEGHSIPTIANPPSCCPGLRLIRPKSPGIIGSYGICTAKCGNGVCDSATESSYNCPQDCKGECGWCGLECVRKSSGMICPTIAPPEGYECKEINGICQVVRKYEECIGDGKIVRKLGYVYGECCEGLHEIASGYKNGVVYCTSEVCGNGKCTALENEWNCPQDCGHTTTTIPKKCYDSDGGRNYYVKGTVIDKYGHKYTDHCQIDLDANASRVIEFYCLGNQKVGVDVHTCPNGCIDGVCIGTPTTTIPPICKDSDGGKNFYKRGTVVGLDKSGRYVRRTDRCVFATQLHTKAGIVDSQSNELGKNETLPEPTLPEPLPKPDISRPSLIEYYCRGNNVAFVVHTCENGCINGACMQQKDYVDILVTPKTQKTVSGQSVEYKIKIKDKHVPIPCVVGEICTKKIYTYLLIGETEEEVQLDEGSIGSVSLSYPTSVRLSAGGEKEEGLIASTSGYDEDKRVKISLQAFLMDDKSISDSDSVTLIVLPENETRKCYDSDGGKNYYVRGKTNGYYHGSFIKGRDTCLSDPERRQEVNASPYLGELYCEDTTNLNFEVYTCPNGCEDGACIKNETVCTDSDGGKNYFIRGKTFGLDKDGKYVERTDNCMAIAPQCKPGGECPPAVHYVEEYYCYNSRVVSDMFECPNGCEDGACVRTPTTTITIPPTVTIVTTTQPEVDPTELLDITIKLEQAIIKVHKVRNTVEAIADYYESIGSEEAKKWRKAVNLLNEIQERLGKAKEDLKDVKTRDQLNAVKIKVEGAYNLIEEVIRIILYS